jgi:uncharacterized protein YxjI
MRKTVSDPIGAQQQDLKTEDGRRGARVRYRMSADLAVLGDEFLVLNDAGEHVFRIDGDLLANEDTISVEDLSGMVLYRASAHLARKQDRIAVFDGTGQEVGAVMRKPVSPLRDQFVIQCRDARDLTVDGSVATHEFSIVGESGRVAEVSRRWFRSRGSYGVEVASGTEDALLLIAIVAMDFMILGGD